MAIRRLKIVSVRNHKDAEFYFSPGVTVIWGENGSGKTAILEAINILSFGKSFKTHRQRELINIKTSELFIRGEFCAGGQEDVVAACVDKKSGQIIKLNGKKILSRKELLGRNIVVVLSPEEQGITRGAPSIKRSFFDRVFSVVSPGYLKTLQQYVRALKQRNIALLQFRDGIIRKDALESWVEDATSGCQNLMAHSLEFPVRFVQIIFRLFPQGLPIWDWNGIALSKPSRHSSSLWSPLLTMRSMLPDPFVVNRTKNTV